MVEADDGVAMALSACAEPVMIATDVDVTADAVVRMTNPLGVDAVDATGDAISSVDDGDAVESDGAALLSTELAWVFMAIGRMPSGTMLEGAAAAVDEEPSIGAATDDEDEAEGEEAGEAAADAEPASLPNPTAGGEKR